MKKYMKYLLLAFIISCNTSTSETFEKIDSSVSAVRDSAKEAAKPVIRKIDSTFKARKDSFNKKDTVYIER